jgi:hypothetical protein
LLHPRFGAEFRIEGVIIDFWGSIPYRGMGGKNEDGIGGERLQGNSIKWALVNKTVLVAADGRWGRHRRVETRESMRC